MTGSDAADGPVAGGGSDDEAVWRDLVARFDAPVLDDASVPWPEREDLAGSPRQNRAGTPRSAAADTLPGIDPVPGPLGADGEDGSGATADSGDTVAFSPAQRAFTPRPSSPSGPERAPGRSGASGPVSEENDHFVPPPPPPLPTLDPVTKGAWAALFGGPAYLLIATAVGWTVPGIAAFLAVAAFVGGFAVLVLRMDDGPPRDSGPDDGAVV